MRAPSPAESAPWPWTGWRAIGRSHQRVIPHECGGDDCRRTETAPARCHVAIGRDLHGGPRAGRSRDAGHHEHAVCRNVLGFGSFEPIEPSTLKAGQPVIVYCELLGLHYKNSGQSFVTRLSSRVELVDARSNSRVWEQPLGEAEDECRSRRRDNYANLRLNLPTSVKPGDYRLKLTQTDLVANQTASAELPVSIAP